MPNVYKKKDCMKTATRTGRKPVVLSDNALVKQAMENIWKIDEETKQRKLEQLDTLRSAKHAIMTRLNELNDQLVQIDQAMAAVTGQESTSPRQRRTRRNLDDVRERVARWMESRRGQQFLARDLMREFSELEGVQVSMFLKPLIEIGSIKTDVTEGMRRTKYYVES